MKALAEAAERLGCVVRRKEPLNRHTTFKTGGCAELFIEVNTQSGLSELLKIINGSGFRFFLLGNGSNVLAPDGGYDGVILKLCGEFENMHRVGEDALYCGAGALLVRFCTFARECCLSGMEFAYGIPGTLGGAVYMNAGAYGSEIKNVISDCLYMDYSGEIHTASNEEMQLGYRTSVFQKKPSVILGAKFKLIPDNGEEIRMRMDGFMQRRRDKQPLEFPSAGSTFKRPEGNYAGALIEQCGLKGRSVGGAQVSEKHAGFIINRQNAASADIKELISLVQAEVLEKTGYELKKEVIYL